MPDGFLVTLGDDTIDPGDSVAATGPSTFFGSTFLGTGFVRWTNGSTTSGRSGDFFLADDGSVYFVPNVNPSAGAQGGTATVVSYSGSQPPVPCFTSGTLIGTPAGPKPVERLVVGELVTVRGGPPQPILWLGHREIEKAPLHDLANGSPIELKLGGLGSNLMVSPQHAIYFDLDRGGRLVRAQQLLRLRKLGARRMRGLGRVRYHHILLPRHHLVQANGIWCESLYPGPRACAGWSPDQRVALRKCKISDYGPPVAPYAKLNEIRDITGNDLKSLLVATNTRANDCFWMAS